eukprot:CAMPEP_0197836550 /NCGR_PEP_ID=MMETSP1437-20131217/29354_1 /TAXON_ID=49252 ORGANISM="Eucampia antarctica, Strain CCMP1452" /NCGR_SAMPLE_ID=MMETSP1437 /ASSEMBLY_ACC=CAM_ASM_001096 /LENGTH=213 /DNA_ID=CAMNT_0043442819 /DNA_START=68 /DNA_END=709 /DNA_ORIENTATION=-
MIQIRGLLLLTACFTLSASQDYREYADEYGQQDNLYADYAIKQQNKGADGGGGAGLGKMLLVGGLGWFTGGKVHSKRLTNKLKKAHLKEQKTLYAQYYNDVYKIQQQNAELSYAAEQIQHALSQMETDREMEAVQRDYDEFKSPDIDGDDRISRAEFSMYVKNYLSNYPGLSEAEYPMFDDFDHDGDGFISFQEYAQQMALQISQAEKAHTKN